jgi:hypothetical protein
MTDKLSAYDRAICRAYAYKLRHNLGDEAYQDLDLLLDDVPPLPSIFQSRKRVQFLAGFEPQIYDCCVNSCCCYAHPNYASLDSCPYCDHPRHTPEGQPFKRFIYIPLAPRLQAMAQNKAMAEKMSYRAERDTQNKEEAERGRAGKKIRDVFDGTLYHSLREEYVTVGEDVKDYRYFSDRRDVALGLSTDGVGPFKKRRHTCWPLMIVNYNLPPESMFLMENLMSVGVIPGPKKPKDSDSFLWPFHDEMHRLAEGIKSFDVLADERFWLHAYLIIVFGDIPAMSMLMRMKGHNGFCPCRMCKILGVRLPGDTANTTYYVPLNRSNHPDVIATPGAVKVYDPATLPLRSHAEFKAQADEIEAAISSGTHICVEQLSKLYGLKGLPLLYHISSLRFPISFPYDFMHLIWENLIKNLILLWTGEFKKLDEGTGAYTLAAAIWKAIGEATGASKKDIPSAYGAAVPNIADPVTITAEMWSFWTLYIGPVLLRNRFQNVKYYNHFVELVRLLTLCLKFELRKSELQDIRSGFIAWVLKYEEYVYPSCSCCHLD